MYFVDQCHQHGIGVISKPKTLEKERNNKGSSPCEQGGKQR